MLQKLTSLKEEIRTRYQLTWNLDERNKLLGNVALPKLIREQNLTASRTIKDI